MSRRTTAALLTLQVGFQTCLAAGAPWGRASYGGQHAETLPRRYRATSAVGAVTYAAAAIVVERGGKQSRRRATLAGVAVMMAVGTVVNAASRSVLERTIWTPYCALTALVAWHARRAEG